MRTEIRRGHAGLAPEFKQPRGERAEVGALRRGQIGWLGVGSAAPKEAAAH